MLVTWSIHIFVDFFLFRYVYTSFYVWKRVKRTRRIHADYTMVEIELHEYVYKSV